MCFVIQYAVYYVFKLYFGLYSGACLVFFEKKITKIQLFYTINI